MAKPTRYLLVERLSDRHDGRRDGRRGIPVTAFMIGVVAIIQKSTAREVDRIRRQKEIERVNKRSRALILVATSRERDAVMAVVRTVNDTQPSRQFHPHHVVFGLGQVSQTEILLGQSEQGAIGVGASALTASSLISSVDPDYLILTGICFGLRDEQRFGDVLVANQLRVMDHKKVIDAPPGDEPRADALEDPPVPPSVGIRRGDSVTPSVVLLDSLVSAQVDWTGQPVHFGPMLSANTLVNSAALRRQLIRQEPDAIGGEMEGAGVYAAAAKAKVDWITVKAISDRGVDKTDEAQSLAARNAAKFVIHTISTGALDPRSLPVAQATSAIRRRGARDTFQARPPVYPCGCRERVRPLRPGSDRG